MTASNESESATQTEPAQAVRRTAQRSHPNALATLRSSPDIFIQLAEQSMLVAERLRHTYFDRTVALADALSELAAAEGSPLQLVDLPGRPPAQTTVAFVDGGVGVVNLNVSLPVIVRAGIFRVKEGETDLDARETFVHFPLLLGELEGGLKTDPDYSTVVRLLVEAAALRAALEAPEFDDVQVLMLHGPLVWLADPLFHHWFPTEDYRRILGDGPQAHRCLDEFDAWCRRCHFRDDADCRRARAEDQLPAMCLLAFLLNGVLDRCREEGKLICGAVEHSGARSLLRRVLAILVEQGHPAVLGFLEGEAAGRVPERLVDDLLRATRFHDTMLFSLVLPPGSCTRPEVLNRKQGDERSGLFPRVLSSYLKPRRSRPFRVELPTWLGSVDQIDLLNRIYAYADLLPGYAYPLGLDIVDKFTRVPSWMTRAFETQIKLEYGRLLGGERPELGRVAEHFLFARDRGSKNRPGVI